MDFRTRIAAAAVALIAAAGLAVWQLGTAPRLGAFLAILVLAYAFGPSVVDGVPEN